MPKYVILGGGGRWGTWRLPADANLDEIRATVSSSMTAGNYAEVTVEMGDDPTQRGTLVVNGNAAPFFVVIETREPVFEPSSPDVY